MANTVYRWLEGDPDPTPPDPEEVEVVKSKREREWEARFLGILLLKRVDGSMVYPRFTFVRDGVWVCPSTSRQGLEHQVFLRDGRIACTCEGWLVRGYCKHTLFPEWVNRSLHFVEVPSAYYCASGSVPADVILRHIPACKVWEMLVYQHTLVCRHTFPDWMVRRMVGWVYPSTPTWLRERKKRTRLPKDYDPFALEDENHE